MVQFLLFPGDPLFVGEKILFRIKYKLIWARILSDRHFLNLKNRDALRMEAFSKNKYIHEFEPQKSSIFLLCCLYTLFQFILISLVLKIMSLKGLGISSGRCQAKERDLLRTFIISHENWNYESRCEVMGTDKLSHGKYMKMVKKGKVGRGLKISYSVSLFAVIGEAERACREQIECCASSGQKRIQRAHTQKLQMAI